MKDKDARRWIETLQKENASLRRDVESLRAFRGAQEAQSRRGNAFSDALLEFLGIECTEEPSRWVLRKKSKKH